MSKFDYNYWRKMTWDWYVVKMEHPKNKNRYRGKGLTGVLKLCNKCNYVYSIDSNLGSSRGKRMFKYIDVPKNGVYKEVCPDCSEQEICVITY
jgi:hypothetical protein